MFETCEPRQVLAGMAASLYWGPNAAELDGGFGSGGRVMTDVPGPNVEFGVDTAITQPDGKTVVLANSSGFSGVSQYLTRFNVDGTLDTTFGNDGVYAYNYQDFFGTALALHPDGDLLVTGRFTSPGHNGFALKRFTPEGQPDVYFANGQVTFDFSGDGDEAVQTLVQADGKLVIVGHAMMPQGRVFAAVRYHDDGNFDHSFGDGGLAILDFGTNMDEIATDAALQSDGGIVVLGSVFDQVAQTSNSALGRFAADGSVDTSFGSAGGQVIDLGPIEYAASLAVQPNDALVVAAYGGIDINNDDMIAARFDPSGELDASFGTGGIVRIDFDNDTDGATDVVLQADGKIVLGGRTDDVNDLSRFALVRLNADGTLDHDFGDAGRATAAVVNGQGYGEALAQQADGSFVLAGHLQTQSPANAIDVGLVRFDSEGVHDLSYGESGFASHGLLGPSVHIERTVMANQADGKVLVAGTILGITGGFRWGVVRYNANGSLDTSFGDGGTLYTGVVQTNSQIAGIAVQPDGKFLLAGASFDDFTGFNLAVVRYHADGAVDTAFGDGGAFELDLGGSLEDVRGIGLQSDGRIVLLGNTLSTATNTLDVVLVRLNADGSVDDTFGTGGVAVSDLGGMEEPRSLQVLSNDKVVVGGRTDGETAQDYFLAQYDASGALDPGFGNAGVVLGTTGASVFGIEALALQSDGGLLGLMATPDSKLSVFRFLSDGSLDTSFGTAGVAAAAFPFGIDVTAIALQSDGGIIAGGIAFPGGATGNDYGVVRFHPNGVLDVRFGIGGTHFLDVNSPDDRLYAISIAADDGILLGGTSMNMSNFTADFATVKLRGKFGVPTSTIAEGRKYVLDLAFGDVDLADMHTATIDWGDGSSQESGSLSEYAGNGTLRATHKYVENGVYPINITVTDTGGETAYWTNVVTVENVAPIVYYGPSPAELDPNFGGGDGLQVTEVPGPTMDMVLDIATQADGKTIVLGSKHSMAGSEHFLARYNADGTLDSTFGNVGMISESYTVAGIEFSPVAVAVAADGSILVGGGYNENNYQYSVRRYSSLGVRDLAYAGSGQVLFDFGPNEQESPQEMLMQPDGKLVVGGIVTDSQGWNRRIGVARFNADGSVDTDFGAAGGVALPIGDNEYFHALALQTDGRLVLLGGTWDGNNHDIQLRRFTAAGDVDTDFGTGGVVLTDLGYNEDMPTAVVASSAGIFVTGTSQSEQDFVVVKYDFDGELAAAFGDGGFARIDFAGGIESAAELLVHSDGQIVVVGSTQPTSGGQSFGVARIDETTGALDATFGTGGMVTTNLGGLRAGASVVAGLSATGDIMVSGYVASDVFFTDLDVGLAHITHSGELDVNFAGDGVVTLGLRGPSNNFERTVLAVQPDGKTLVAGNIMGIGAGQYWGVARYNVDGSLDSTFGDQGTLTVLAGSAFQRIGGIALQPDGKILLTGTVFGLAMPLQMGVARLNADGSLDTSFGDGGVALHSFSNFDQPRAIAVQPDGKILIGGSQTFAGQDYFVSRLLADGSLDLSFGHAGVTTTDVGPMDFLNGLQLLADGSIVVGGQSGGLEYSLVKYTSGGALDAAFGDAGIARSPAAMPMGILSLAEQSDGKLVGSTTVMSPMGNAPAIVRFLADGSLDTSFGNNGVAAADIGMFSGDGVSVAVQANGKLLVTGTVFNPATFGPDFIVARFNADGTADLAFGESGVRVIDIHNGHDTSWDVAVAPDGGILLGGTTFQFMSGATTFDFALVGLRGDSSPPATIQEGQTFPLQVSFVDPAGPYDWHEASIDWGDGATESGVSIDQMNDTTYSLGESHRYLDDGVFTITVTVSDDDGGVTVWTHELTVTNAAPVILPGPNPVSLDPDFGIVKTDIPGANFDHTVDTVTLPGGAIVTLVQSVGFSGVSYHLLRYLPNGNLDPDFGTGGDLVLPGNDYQRIEVQGGKLLLSGSIYNGENSDLFVTRLDLSGDVDESFGEDGYVQIDLGGNEDFRDMVVGVNQIVLVAQYDSVATAIVQLQADFGALDESFSLDGISIVDLSPDLEDPRVAALFPDGSIGVAGTVRWNDETAVFVAKVDFFTGALVGSFGDGGFTVTSFGPDGVGARDLAVQSDGKVLLAVIVNAEVRDFTLLQYDAGGILDTNFGTGGIVQTDFYGFSDDATEILLRPDDTFFVVGNATSSSGETSAAVARYNSDGSLDVTYGTDGTAVLQVAGVSLPVQAGSLQADGQIVLGLIHVRANPLVKVDVAVTRFTALGEVDTGFGDAGLAVTGFPGSTMNFDQTKVAVQPDGKTLVAGVALDMSGLMTWHVVRYNIDGSLDITFADDGIAQDFIPNAIAAFIGDFVIQPDGSIVIAGVAHTSTGPQPTLVRLDSSGALDATFGTGGIVQLDVGQVAVQVNDIAIQADGKLVVTGDFTAPALAIMVLRFNTDGSLDESFGVGGLGGLGGMVFTLVRDTNSGEAVAIQSDGKIVVGGRANGDPVIVRYDSTGQLDSSFGDEGIMLPVADTQQGIEDLKLAADGKIVAVATSAAGDALVIRLNSDGSADETIGPHGRKEINFNSSGQALSVALQADGKILVAGYSFGGGPESMDFAVARLTTAGELDAGFGIGGFFLQDLGSVMDQGGSIAIDPTGGFVVSGISMGNPTIDLAVVHFRGDVTPDWNAAVGSSFSLVAYFTDAGVLDTHTATIDWGDGSLVSGATIDEAGGQGTATGMHSYTAPGVYTAIVSVTDDDGLTTEREFVITVSGAAAGTTVSNGDHLAITDVPGNTANNLTIGRVGDYIRISDPDNPLVALAGTIQIDAHTIDVLASSVVGLLIVDVRGGSDTLTIDLSGGNPIPVAGVSYQAGEAADDRLQIIGGELWVTGYNYFSESAGFLALAGYGIVNFGETEIVGSATPTDYVYLNLAGGGDSGLAVTDLGDGIARLTNSGTFPTTEFAVPNAGGSLSFALGTDDQRLEFNSLVLAADTRLIIDGGDGTDDVVFAVDVPQTLTGDVTVFAEVITQGHALVSTGHVMFTQGAVTLLNPFNEISGRIDGYLMTTFSLFNTTTFSLGDFSVTGNVMLLGSGSVQQVPNREITAAGAFNVFFTSGDVLLDSADNDFQGPVSIGTAGTVSLRDANDLMLGSMATGNLTLDAAGDIMQSGGITADGDVSVAATNVELDSSFNYFQGAVSVLASVARIRAAEDLLLNAATVGSLLSVQAGGSVSQTLAGLVAVELAVRAETGITLGADQNNDVDTVALMSTSGAVTYADSSYLKIGNVDAVVGVSAENGLVHVQAAEMLVAAPVSAPQGSVGLSATTIQINSQVSADDILGAVAEYYLDLSPQGTLISAGSVDLQLTQAGSIVVGGTISSGVPARLMGSPLPNALEIAGTAIFSGLNVQGNGGFDLLLYTGAADSQWNVTGANTGNIQGLNSLVQFANISAVGAGSGNDIFAFSMGGSLSGSVEGNGGSDTLDYSAFTIAVVADLLTGVAPALNGIYGIENLTGGSANDTLMGDDFDNVLIGNGGNDALNGKDGADMLSGGAGNDMLNGGVGDDRYVFDTDTAQGVDRLTETGGVDTLDFSTTTTIGVTVRLAIAANQVVNGNLTLNLGSATTIENVIGGAGNDTFTGNELSNRLAGGAGDDTYNFATATAVQTDVVVELPGEGIDHLNFSTLASGDTLAIDLAGTASVQIGSHANRTLQVGAIGQAANFENVTGGDGSDVIVGNAANNVLIGGNGNDTLWGGLGINTLIGSGGFDWAVGARDVDFTLTATTLTGSDGAADTLTTMESVNLSGGASNNVYTVNGWTGTGWFVGGGGSDTINATANLNFALGDTALAIGTKSITLESLEVANLTGGAGNNSFTVSDWTGTGSLNGVSGADRLYYTKDTSLIILSDADLTAAGMFLTLGNIGRADLTGGGGINTFSVAGWTGNLTVAGGGDFDAIIAQQDANFTLTNTSLAITGLPTWTISGLESALLNGGESDNTFTVTGWTGNGYVAGNGGNDTVVATRNSDFTLTNTSLTASDGLTFDLSGVEAANLSGQGGNNNFDVSGWTGGGKLTGAGGSDTVNVTKDANFTLTSTSLTASDGLNLVLATTEVANLTGGASANTFDVGGWNGTGALVGGGGLNTVAATRNADFTLANNSLAASGAFTMSLSAVTRAELTGGASANTFNLSGWSGIGSLDGGSGNDILVMTKSNDFLIDDFQTASSDGMAMVLSSIEIANLTGDAGVNRFNVEHWTGRGTLTGGGGADAVRVVKGANYELTNTRLQTDDGMDLTLAGIGRAELDAGPANATFDINGWTGNGRLTASGAFAAVSVTRDANFTLTDSLLTVSDGTVFELNGINVAELEGGAGNNIIDASGFSGAAVLSGMGGNDFIFGGAGDDWLTGGGGNDALVGNGGNDTLAGGAGRDLIIGGTGADNGEADLVPTGIDGGGGDDLLIAGTTAYDANQAALAAIMAEWTSGNSYAIRVANLRNGTGLNGGNVLRVAGDAGAGPTTVFDDDAVDNLRGQAGVDWFFASALEDILLDRTTAAETLSNLD